jgi:hypothetical protein
LLVFQPALHIFLEEASGDVLDKIGIGWRRFCRAFGGGFLGRRMMAFGDLGDGDLRQFARRRAVELREAAERQLSRCAFDPVPIGP